ncbi:hypothetical protein NIES4106_56880 (plasmid) [Fischerella sp. NIES-4106]|nr:hypothetical protein NIES4106_56880 [Fischerella sp. NIES-4106]
MLTLEEQTNSSISLSLSPASFESDIAKASQLWEQATDLLLQAGRLFQGVKASTKRKINTTKDLTHTTHQQARVAIWRELQHLVFHLDVSSLGNRIKNLCIQRVDPTAKP